MFLTTVVFLLSTAVSSIQCQSYVQPEQIHISYGGSPSSVWITWVTFEDTNTLNKGSVVEYGKGKLTDVKYGTRTEFVDGGPEHRKIFS